MVNNIKNDTISETDAKKNLNALSKQTNKKTVIIKHKKRTPGNRKSLNLFNDLSDIILTDKTLESQENKKEENEIMKMKMKILKMKMKIKMKK